MINGEDIFEGAEFIGVTVRDFQTINRKALEEGLMAKVIFIDDSPFGRTVQLHLGSVQ